MPKVRPRLTSDQSIRRRGKRPNEAASNRGFAAAIQSAQSAPDGKVPPAAMPANPNRTPEAREPLREIDQISGDATLTGQHNFLNQVSRWVRTIEGRPSMVEEAIRQFRNGAVIALTWHTDDDL